MKIVLDTSAAIEIALDGKDCGHYWEIVSQAEAVLAPELLVAEVVNTVWKLHQSRQLEIEKCEWAVEFALGLVETLVSHRGLYRDALELSFREERRAVYDMFYLALARREGATLLTLDKGLRKEAKRQGIRVI